MNIFGNILLQAPAGGVGGSSSMGIIVIIAMIVIFYFFMIRPQQKRQKEIQKARNAMKTGDKVIIAGGIHGRIKEIEESTMLIEVSEGVRIRVDKASVFANSQDSNSKA